VLVGVLVPIDPERPVPPPEARPIGRAALMLRAEGVPVAFGDEVRGGCLTGLMPRPGGWERVEQRPVVALLDRFPSQTRAARFGEIQRGLDGVPLLNVPAFTELCRDKLRCQQVLEQAGVPAPPVEADPERFAERLAQWGAGFLKPRFGALGVGVRRVTLGDPLPARLPGVRSDSLDPALLQRAVAAPSGWAGVSVRVLAQRAPGGGWEQGEPVVRRSRGDSVVNAARGAEVAAGRDALASDTRARVRALTARVTEALCSGPGAIEIGVDLVIDPQGRPHLIEVNSRPRGRMEVLARQDRARFGALHLDACARPLRYLAWRYGSGR
jgi:glutathione synthase/RimK-type ligase-like ATP-grasp enzyme